MTEKQEQIALIHRANLNPITRNFLFSIPNGGKRHLLEAYQLKLQGVKSGIPDLMLAYPVNPYHGLFIELKQREARKSRITHNQIMWINQLNQVGYCALVCYGWEDAWGAIMNYLQS